MQYLFLLALSENSPGFVKDTHLLSHASPRLLHLCFFLVQSRHTLIDIFHSLTHSLIQTELGHLPLSSRHVLKKLTCLFINGWSHHATSKRTKTNVRRTSTGIEGSVLKHYSSNSCNSIGFIIASCSKYLRGLRSELLFSTLGVGVPIVAIN
jgi:hypothetical protein